MSEESQEHDQEVMRAVEEKRSLRCYDD